MTQPQISAEAVEAIERRLADAKAQLAAAVAQYDATANQIVGDALELGIPVNVVEATPADVMPEVTPRPEVFADAKARDLMIKLEHDLFFAGEVHRILRSWTIPGTNDPIAVMALAGDIPDDVLAELAVAVHELGWV